ncbi:ensconsin isoform X8 [Pseudoliparis swirei]|uniref:ensconsin isoform X8 n=1 Tax=Pseudoliparis swirei TaxID=2059687 RepID=UPI0024BD990F|nr:ensconsin isoform X8 [Pseudoliparis swirei]
MADQDGSDASPPESQASYSQCISEGGRSSSIARRGSSGSGHTSTPAVTPTSGPTATHTTSSNSSSNNAAAKAVVCVADSLLFNRMDERQRLARERRGEREKLNAVKEAEWQAREERARLQFEKQVEERRRRLEDQRVKEDRRRLAVEGKRRQKLEEDKARHEAVIGRTLERNQKTKQKPNRWSWGGPLQTNTPSTPADAERRSVSTMNLSKHTDPVFTKRLSYSSATLLHSPDRGLRCLPLTPWESNVVNRLQQPTHSYLARSRSAMSLSGEQTAMPVCPRSVSCHPMGSMSFKALQAPPLPLCRSQERSLSRGAVSSSSSTTTARRKTTGTTQQKDRDNTRKSWSNLSLPLAPILTLPPKMPPFKKNRKGTSPSPGRPPIKSAGRPSTPRQLKSPGADDPGNFRPFRVPESHQPIRAPNGRGEEQALGPLQPRPQPLGQNKTSGEHTAPAASERISSPSAHKPSAGTTDPEEASRILAVNRRLAREQREKDEGERKQQEEQRRLAQEEMARRKGEERVKREEEAQRQAEETRKNKEEEERKGAEERLQKEREEAERLLKQKEEEESRQRKEAEQVRQEREKHFQKEEAERLERKKRLDEIMKRTRRSDTAEKKVVPNRNGDGAVTPAAPSPSAVTASPTHNGNDHQPEPDATALSRSDQRENGEFEEVIVLPPHSRLSPPEGEEEQQQVEERVPILAFRKNGLLKPLSGSEDISAQQGADVA